VGQLSMMTQPQELRLQLQEPPRSHRHLFHHRRVKFNNFVVNFRTITQATVRLSVCQSKACIPCWYALFSLICQW
jgi:hypothetical protein